MTKVIEIVFRHKWSLLVLLLLPTLVGLVIAVRTPRQYEASAGLWALRRYEIIGASGPESDLTSTPAQTQVTTLSQLLQSRSFALAVAYDTDLPNILGASVSGTQNLQDALYTELSTNVVATPIGYNLFDITYVNKDPAVALQVVKAVVSHYGSESSSQATQEGEQLLVSYETQLTAAQKAAEKATQAAAQYLQAQQLSPAQAQVDPQYQQLVAQATQTNAVVVTIQDNITTTQQQLDVLGTGSEGLYTVIDAPALSNHPVSRTKTFLLAGGIGVLLGLLAAISYFLMLARLDQSLYSPADVPDRAPYPVLIQIPQLPHRSIGWSFKSGGKYLLKGVTSK